MGCDPFLHVNIIAERSGSNKPLRRVVKRQVLEMILQREPATSDDGNADGIHVSKSEACEYASEKTEGNRSARIEY